MNALRQISRQVSQQRAVFRRTFSKNGPLSEEEKAAENVYIRKKEAERIEKLRAAGVHEPEKVVKEAAGGGYEEPKVEASSERSNAGVAFAAGLVAVGVIGWWMTSSNKKKEDESKY
eukprot:jgi/Mesen1/9789/ME000007S09843